MYFFFLLVWIIFNGRITPEIFIFGAVLSVFINLFFRRLMGYKAKTDLLILRNLWLGIGYLLLVIAEVIKANIAVIKLVLSPKIEVNPVLVHFKTDLQSDLARVALANSITLTPGTITCDLTEDGTYWVHCMDKSMAEGMEESSFVQLLRRMEGKSNGSIK